jgi:hypothetical protein
MNQTALVIGSVITAFIISAGGAIAVGFTAGNGKLNQAGWVLSCVFGAISAAKDFRSLMKLPPVQNGTNGTDKPPTP